MLTLLVDILTFSVGSNVSQKGVEKRLGTIDLDTGEVFQAGIPVWVNAKVRWREDWFMAFQDAFVGVASDKDMTFDMVKVWLYLLGNVGFENWVAKPQTEIAKTTGIHKVNVSKAIKALCKKGLILQGPKLGRTVSLKINSKYAWKGKIKHLAKDRVVDFFSEQYKRNHLKSPKIADT